VHEIVHGSASSRGKLQAFERQIVELLDELGQVEVVTVIAPFEDLLVEAVPSA
jgi:hypothetical protein